jgi:hypothetical protein
MPPVDEALETPLPVRQRNESSLLPKHGLGERVFVRLTMGHNLSSAEVVPEEIDELALAPYPLGMFCGPSGSSFQAISVSPDSSFFKRGTR